MKKLTLFSVILMVVLANMVFAGRPIGVFANKNTNCIQFIDPITQTVSDHLLKGDLGTYAGGLMDVVITSDRKTAIVSNMGDSRIYFIDISRGFNDQPILLGSTWVFIPPEDMAITPDDNYVVVTDGGNSNHAAVVDIPSRSLVRVQYLKGASVQAAAVTPDGELVLFADYGGGALHSYRIDGEGTLSYKETQLIRPFSPVNVAISPDGKTVIVVHAFSSRASVFLIDSMHDLCFQEYISLPARGGQSCVFSGDGAKAYYLTNANPGKGTQVHILDVASPGKVAASGTSITVTPARGTGHFYGIETIALDPWDNYLYVTNPVASGAVTGISIIDLATHTEVGYLMGTGIPTGICFTALQHPGGNE